MMELTTRPDDVRTAVMAAAMTALGLVGTAAAHANHSNATDHDEAGGIPWFPIIVGGLFLLMVGIMAVRRVIDHGDAEDELVAGDGDGG